MKYMEYNGFTKTYVVIHSTGTGVVEDQFIDHHVVYETDNIDEAKEKANELTKQNNTAEEIESTWYSNNYFVNVNILSKKGKELLKEFNYKFDEKLKKGLEDGIYDKVKIGDITLYKDNRFNF